MVNIFAKITHIYERLSLCKGFGVHGSSPAAPLLRLGSNRAILMLMCALLLASCTFFGCAAKTPYEVLEGSVISELDAYKKVDRSMVDKFIEYMDISELEQFDIDPVKFTESFFADFDYSIDSITVDDSSAEVVVTIVSKDYLRFEEMLASRVDEMEAMSAKRNISSERYKQMYGAAVMDCMDGVDTVLRQSIRIGYTMDGNTWRPSSEMFYVVMNTLVPLANDGQ